MNQSELLALKQEISKAKETKNKLEARQEVLTEQMKDRFGVATIAAARKKIKSMGKEITDWQEKIDTAIEELETKLEENDQDSNTEE